MTNPADYEKMNRTGLALAAWLRTIRTDFADFGDRLDKPGVFGLSALTSLEVTAISGLLDAMQEDISGLKGKLTRQRAETIPDPKTGEQ